MNKKIVFICTGNMCRSPMAEGMLKKMLYDIKKINEIKVESAGLLKTDGSRATTNAIKTMKNRGVDITQHTARHVSKEDYRRCFTYSYYDCKP